MALAEMVFMGWDKMKEWELDWNMIEGEDVGALFGQEGQDEKDIDRIKSDYDNWLRDIQDNTRSGLSPVSGSVKKPEAVGLD